MRIFINIIFSIAIWGSIAFALFKTIAYSDKEMNEPFAPKRCSALKIGIFAVIFRLIIFVICALMIDADNMTFSVFLEKMKLWDATHYYRIASGGYTGYIENGDYVLLVFFPFYPAAVKVLSFIIPNIYASMLIVSTLTYAVGCAFLYKLVLLDYPEDTAINSVIWISVFPFAFFFGAMMTESMFFMTTVIALYFIRKHNWLAAGIFGMMSAATRMVGLFITVAAFIEWIDYCRPFSKDFFKKLLNFLPMAITIIGTIIYLFINYKVSGTPIKFIEYQGKYWHNGNCYFGKMIADVFDYTFSKNTETMIRISIWIPSMVMIIVSTALIICSSFKMRNMYAIYFAGYIIINCSLKWPISEPRYMSCAVPMFILIGDLLAKKKELNIVLLSESFIFFLIYLYRYLHGMQVM